MAGSERDLTREELRALGRAQQEMLDDLQDLVPQIAELWQKAGVLVDKGGEMPGEPERIAEYTVQRWSLDEVIRNATENTAALHVIANAVDRTQALKKLRELELASKAVNPKLFAAIVSSEATEVLKNEQKRVHDYFQGACVNLIGVLANVYAPLQSIRNLLLSYLNEPQGSADKLQLLFTIVKTIGIDVLAHHNPLISPAVAVAEKLKEQAEKRENELRTGVQEWDRFLALNRGIRESLKGVRESGDRIAAARAEAERLDSAFEKSMVRLLGALAIVKEAETESQPQDRDR